jgi:hypothetical protein
VPRPDHVSVRITYPVASRIGRIRGGDVWRGALGRGVPLWAFGTDALLTGLMLAHLRGFALPPSWIRRGGAVGVGVCA